MSSQYEIDFNYNQAISQAGELEDISERLKKLSENDLQDVMDDLSSAWKSDSAGQYINKVNRLNESIRSTSRNLKEISAAIRNIARNVKDAETAAQKIADQRDS